MVTKRDIEKDFIRSFRNQLTSDIPRNKMMWTEYTEMLARDGIITEKQRMNWGYPRLMARKFKYRYEK